MFNYVPMTDGSNVRERIYRLLPVFALALSLCLALVALSGTAQAQDGKDKYGFVNISQVISKSDEGVAEAAELESLGAEKQQVLNARKQELEDLAAQYQKTVDSGSPDAELRERIEKLQRELERDARQAQSDVDVSRQDRIQQLGVKVVQIVQQYAEDNGYSAIFRIDNGQMVYVDPAVDITPQILEAYNKAHPVKE